MPISNLSWKHYAGAKLQRHVTFGTFTVAWGDPLIVTFSDLRIANATWGSVPEMVNIGYFSARIDVRSLLHGKLRYENLRIRDATIVLERNPAGIGNWKFPAGGLGALAVVPRSRTQFPTLIDFALARALVTYRTTSGRILRIAMDRMLSHTADDKAPITLQVDGAYNDVAATLDAVMQSGTVLRDARVPYGAKLTLSGDATKAAFDGTMMEPLDFDGVQGPLTLNAPTLDGLLKMFGMTETANLPWAIAGNLKRERDDWSLSKVSGNLAKSSFAGSLSLHENGRGKPDDISADLDSKALDVDAIQSQIGDGKTAPDLASLPLQMEITGVNLAAKLSSDEVKLAAMHFGALQFDGRLLDGNVTLRSLAFALADGTFHAAGSLNQVKAGGNWRSLRF